MREESRDRGDEAADRTAQPGAHGGPPVVLLPVSGLRKGESPRLTGGSEQHAVALAESGVRLPPILVHRESLRVVDGMHRLRAAELRGEQEIEARFFDGTDAEAFVAAVRANAEHGLPLSLADRKAAAARIVGFHPDWSSRAIGRIVGLDGKTVDAIRRASAEIPQLPARAGRDGRVRPLDTSGSRQRAGELLACKPEASLRVISAEVGISVATVRDVRDRMRRGETATLAKRGIGPARDAAAEPAGGPESAAPTGVFGRTAVRRRVADGRNPTAVLRALCADPSLRLTESGRTVLRKLDGYVMDGATQQLLISAIPDHCAGLVADLLAESARAWQEVAAGLRSRTPRAA